MSLNRKIVILLFIILLFGLNRLELFDPLQDVSFSKVVYSEEGEILRLTLSDDEKYRLHTPLEKISPDLQKAVLLAEDQFFYYHYGLNPISLFRAIGSIADQRPVGASTITMQYVRLKHKIYSKSFFGKAKQIFFAIGAEFIYSKRQILEAYLNLTPYGANIEGLGAASVIFFKKESLKISFEHALLLAVVPQNPLSRGLNKDENQKAELARKRLAKRWSEKYKTPLKEMTSGLPSPQKKLSEIPFEAPHFVQFVLQQPTKVRQSYWSTTLNLKWQKSIEMILQQYLKSKQSVGVKNAAVLILDAEDRSIKTWIGSGDFFNNEISGQIDAITWPRSPGSTLKPFIYGLALDEGLIHSQSLLFDTASSFGVFDPENFDRGYLGPISAEEALIQSRNIPAVYLASRLKKKSLFQLLNEVSADLPKPEKFYGLGLALGVAEVSPLKIGELYMSLAENGFWKAAQWRKDAVDSDPGRQILSPESSFIVRQMLQKNTRFESYLLDRRAKELISVSWKTGTSYGFRDAWVAGIVGQHVIVVWFGDFDNNSNPKFIGRDLAAPLFFQIIDLMRHRQWLKPENPFDRLSTKVKSTEVCSLSGAYSNGDCPHHKKAWVIPGTSPINECQVHRAFLISKLTGKRDCSVSENNHLTHFKKMVYEVWPSDVIQLFTKHGIPFQKLPSTFNESCQEYFGLSQITRPQIVSPKNNLKYVVRFDSQKGYEKVPFKAIVDQQSETVFWFANEKPLGRVSRDETLMAELTPGTYEISVIDEAGQVDSRQVVIQTQAAESF